MTTLPLTPDLQLRVHVLNFVTGGPTVTLAVNAPEGVPAVCTRFQIDPSAVDAYEQQLVDWGLMIRQSQYPEPRYTKTAAGFAYLVLLGHNGEVLTPDGIRADIPVSNFGGDSTTIANAMPGLIAAGLVQATSGYIAVIPPS